MASEDNDTDRWMTPEESQAAADAFLPEHVQEFFGDTLHIFAGIRPEQGVGGVSVNASLLQDEDMGMQYARVTLLQSLQDVMQVLENRVNQWYVDHADELTE